MAASSTLYPDEPFAQAESLLTGLIENYRSSSDPSDMADIQTMVEEAVRTAKDREFRVQDSIKELSQKVATAEADAVYSDARTQHEQRMKEINTVILGVQQEVQQLNSDLRGANDQQSVLQQKQKQLEDSKQELTKMREEAEPDRLQRISLYAHITGLAFDYNTLDQPVTQASIADADDGAIRSVPIDHSRPAYEVANMLWDNMDTPQLPH